jgi:hypothetical protein
MIFRNLVVMKLDRFMAKLDLLSFDLDSSTGQGFYERFEQLE